MAPLIKKDGHISNTINNMGQYRALKGRHWRLETHTFHLPCGECIVTLEDVVLQLGLPINRSAVTDVSAIAEPAAHCYSLLGVLPADADPNLRGFVVLTMLYREFCRMTKPDVIDIGGCLVLLQSWALYRMLFLASLGTNHIWSFHSSIERSYTVPIYNLMIEQHAEEGVSYSNIRDM
ncbi:hypothetical protein J1N35_001986 [Gossypium stocksii]|uniref:Aminotransferase-like plant mobile domain-containing protein n=1 Tax=Gossypium stocksii TaxID=47602 RepID=A0A9D4AMW3_9ROSI|nr:hypothetical protein J1N35_001986 [Gossypium stocksii]